MSFYESYYCPDNEENYYPIESNVSAISDGSTFGESLQLGIVEIKEEIYQLKHDKQKLIEQLAVLNNELDISEQTVTDLLLESAHLKREAANVNELREENQLLEKQIGLRLQELVETKEDNRGLKKMNSVLKEDLSQTKEECLKLSQTVNVLKDVENCRIADLLKEEQFLEESVQQLKKLMLEIETLALEMQEMVDMAERANFEDHLIGTSLQFPDEKIPRSSFLVANSQVELSECETLSNVVVADAEDHIISVAEELVSALHTENDTIQLACDLRGAFFKYKHDTNTNNSANFSQPRVSYGEASIKAAMINIHWFHHKYKQNVQKFLSYFPQQIRILNSGSYCILRYSGLLMVCILLILFALTCNCSAILGDIYDFPIPCVFHRRYDLRFITIERMGLPPM